MGNNFLKAQAGVDRFSELPPEIAHHILGFLPIADVIRVSSLSKTCRGLHLSIPILNFDFAAFPYASTLTSDKRLELFNSLDRFLAQRGNNKVKHLFVRLFSFYQLGETEIGSHCGFEKSRILGWIQNAIDCNVEVLKVVYGSLISNPKDYGLDVEIDFPSCVFLCESLRYLKLQMGCVMLKAPSFCTSPASNLVCMSLEFVTIEDGEGFCKWVSYCCRFIKELRLHWVRGLDNITIESSSLEYFLVESRWVHNIDRLVIAGDRVEEIHIHIPNHKKKSLLNISAPNLKYLKWIGSMWDHQHLGEMNCLEQVEISLTSYGLESYDLDSVCEQFLCSISSVKVLILDQVTAKTLFREGFKPAQLGNVWYLLMSIWCSIDDNLVPAITSLFSAVPNLTTLNVSSSPHFPIPHVRDRNDNISGSDGGCWELQGLDFVSKLEEVTIGLTTGSNGFELSRYILEHAPNLKKLSVITRPDQSTSVPDIWRSDPTFNARVVFVEKEEDNYYTRSHKFGPGYMEKPPHSQC